MTVVPKDMSNQFMKAHEMVKNSEDIKIYSHIDCDGISAGAILSITLDRLGIDHELEFISLDKIPDLKRENEVTIFSDLGSGQDLNHFKTSKSKIIIVDHHPPLRNMPPHYGDFLEINPNYHGIDGSFQVSGGGMCYLLAKTFGFYDLSWIGVLSAVGDMQNNMSGKLVGINQLIVEDGIDQGMVASVNDLALYGRQTRPLYVSLSYFGDVKLPFTNDRNQAINLLEKLDIPRKNDDNIRTLYDLSIDEKKRLFTELVRMMSREVPPRYVKYIPRLVSGDAYEFLKEEIYTPLRDASEFSTAINACSRYKNTEIALKVLKGDRGLALDEMNNLGREHRQYLAQNMEWIKEENKISKMDNLQYFNGNDKIKSELIGTITGMVLSYGDWRKPMIGFANTSNDNDSLKVSLRCSRLLAFDGIHFGHRIKKVASKVGGSGGGHSVACGAYIPAEKQEQFLKIFNESLNGMILNNEMY